jgi:thioredoxin-related protein
MSLFLLFFFLLGPGCYAEDSQKPAAVSTSAGVPATGPWSEGWYQGASGYDQATEEYKRTQKPMVVYMSVGWCPYCRKFEKEVLSSPLVRDMLKDKIKVNLNPESGRRENALAAQYGIRGFPSFFLHPPQPAGAVQLYTGVTPEQFVEFFNQVLG